MAQVDTSLFRPELVFFDFEATDEWDFFKQMQRKLQDMGYVKEGWYDVDPENIVKPYIAVIKPKTTIDFAPMADMVDHPVHTELIINLGLLAHAEDQVAVLQAMMGIFMDEEATADIMSRDSAEGIIEAITKRC